MFALIGDADFDQQWLYNRLRQEASQKAKGNVGAIVTFTGLVRDNNADGNILGIELEHYPGMTEQALTNLVQEAITRFSLTSAGAVHRVGRLYNDEQIVWVGTAAPHRAAAFEGANFLMDMLKQSVPLWKKEFTRDNSRWVEVKASDDKAALAWLREK
ncbi:molybdopterin synthase catalytic subunit [Alteromonas sp. KS69]|jgi:molybdopterin synthase catalytic subunit|uniref:molybdenum cofactor biosynthesis protein MoaE n=1 Tax=Alteromonas TaxID=226 RepID=UPI000C10D9F0|nr:MULTISPECIES: molybdenum cofactor biosynthesis protein MoaE [Alteromonas]MBB68140.1 molybdopterin synthase catalytic subunit [Rickettsiales bacterium]MBO7921613.1 molybdenum cofactor biosynthesis protein MoaE [Alteromonas sp. K632G]PHS57878.1 MAG: molybdopterin synthase catalytic subunit [Alteromonas sp.]RUP80619.1 molybdopterin synthase catalytic subunit [Alteromonas sp. KS69]|tara:strand:- start:3643 stop:4116 length:474 start_codon:yes stop_codon:yes gene_type:complete